MSVAQNLRNLAQRITSAKKPSYRIFDVALKTRIVLTPSLTRFVFTGPEVSRMATMAPDQRIKLLFPAPDGAPPQLPDEGDWHKTLRALKPAHRPPMRTYTIRALRPEALEVDVDFVLHGESGPASAWATHACPGDRLQMVAPNADFAEDPGGYEWRPPLGVRQVLLIGDETALPAIAGILEALTEHPGERAVEAFIEVPHEEDRQALRMPPGASLHWFARDALGLAHGQGMQRAARELATLPAWGYRERTLRPLEDVDIERQLPWELAKPTDNAFYAWVAGESAAVMAIRRHWVGELGMDRRALSFMGYWRLGRVLD